MNSLGAALAYANRGWAVVPLHNPADGGRCSCGRADCSSVAKHPRTRNGLKDATTDAETIRSWWRTWPTAGVGIVTGAVSGLVVLDVDPKHDGPAELELLEEIHNPLPSTVQSVTGSGGWHLAFQHPGGVVKNRSGFRPGLDLRGDGGYIVAPPSVHASGNTYRWLDGHGPGELAPAEMPAWLLELVSTPQREAPARPAPKETGNGDGTARLLQDAAKYAANAAAAGEGRRNQAAFNLAGHLAAFVTDTGETLGEGQILDTLRPWNLRNSPPLPESELAAAVKSAMTNGTPRPLHEVKTSKPADAPRPAEKPAKPARAARPAEPWRPFPTERMPPVLARFIVETADALGCDDAFVALPTLATVAAAIGTTRAVELKASWREPCILWAALVARSGTLKSPAFDAAVAPLQRAQVEAFKRYGEAREEYALEAMRHERDVAAWRKSRGGDPPAPPLEPVPERFIVSDCTVEALAPILVNNLRGVLMARDELSGFLRGLNQYKSSGRGADVASWLELWRGGPIVVDRKGDRGPLAVHSAAASVAGTVQPAVLMAILSSDGGEHFESGLAARLLMAAPPAQVKRWSDRTPAGETLADYERLVYRLLELQHVDGPRGPEAYPLPLADAAAYEEWTTWYDAHALRIAAAATDRAAASLAKCEAYAARLGLLVALAENPEADRVSYDAVAAGTALADWFSREALRVYDLLDSSDETTREDDQLVEWVRGRGGEVTARELARALRRYPTVELAEAGLSELVANGLGLWAWTSPGEKGGRPARVFKLSATADTADETSRNDPPLPTEPPPTTPPADVSVASAPSAPPSDDFETWGVL